MRTKILILNCILLVLFSCNKQQEAVSENIVAVADESISQMKMPPPVVVKDETITQENRLEITSTSVPQPETPNHKSTVREKKIIKDGNMIVNAKNIHDSKKSIDNLIKKLNAYYEGEDLQNNNQSVAYHLKIRVPAANFEKLISGLENGKDEIRSKNILTRDVTEEYVDVETRLTNKRDYLKRYKELLSKAATVKDLLAIEENIRNLQEEIESQEGRLNYLKDQVTFSTLNIELYNTKEVIVQHPDGFFTRTKTAINQGWQSIVDFTLRMISIWPYLIVAFISFLIIRRTIKARKNRKDLVG